MTIKQMDMGERPSCKKKEQTKKTHAQRSLFYFEYRAQDWAILKDWKQLVPYYFSKRLKSHNSGDSGQMLKEPFLKQVCKIIVCSGDRNLS